jgi:hypothetical protein
MSPSPRLGRSDPRSKRRYEGRGRRRGVVVGVAATVSAFAVAGLGLLSPSSSRSAALRVGFTAMPAASGHQNARFAVTEQDIRFSFEAPPSWERFRVAAGKYPRGQISVNKSEIGPQDAEAIIYWTSFPNGAYADRCADLLNSQIGPSAAALANAVARAPGTRRVKRPNRGAPGGRPPPEHQPGVSTGHRGSPWEDVPRRTSN